MFKLIGWILKASFFTILVLVAAHYVTWDGRTVSDQVRSTLSSADRSTPLRTLKSKSKGLIEEAREAASRIGVDAKRDEKIPDEDRRRLQALIHSSDEG
jgi:F0F1-type ATP synthase membrane subunit b/b'